MKTAVRRGSSVARLAAVMGRPSTEVELSCDGGTGVLARSRAGGHRQLMYNFKFCSAEALEEGGI